ncbi:MAG: glycosyltransferase family 2 protein, partial [Candidatus Micrarchaeaceae archaeon]
VDKSSVEYRKRLKKAISKIPAAKLIEQKSRSYESAVFEGMRMAHGSIIATIDADGTHETAGIWRAEELIRKSKADIIFGNRFGRLGKHAMSFNILFGNKFLSFLYSLIYQIKLHDILTGLVVMKREAFESIKDVTPYRAGTAIFAIELARRKYNISEIPISYSERKYGNSKLSKSKFFYGLKLAYYLIIKRLS